MLRRTLLKAQGQMSQSLHHKISSQKMKTTEDDDVPPTTTTVTPEIKGRKETLSPTPQVSQTVRSAIEVTAKDFEPSETAYC